MKNYTTSGILIGLGLALCIVFGGWRLLLLAMILGAAGGIVGAHLDGRINIVELWHTLIGKGRA